MQQVVVTKVIDFDMEKDKDHYSYPISEIHVKINGNTYIIDKMKLEELIKKIAE